MAQLLIKFPALVNSSTTVFTQSLTSHDCESGGAARREDAMVRRELALWHTCHLTSISRASTSTSSSPMLLPLLLLSPMGQLLQGGCSGHRSRLFSLLLDATRRGRRRGGLVLSGRRRELRGWFCCGHRRYRGRSAVVVIHVGSGGILRARVGPGSCGLNAGCSVQKQL